MLTKKDIEDVRTVIFVGEERAYEDVVAELRRLAMAGLEADALRERAEKAEHEIERLRSDAKTLAADFDADYRAAIARADKAEAERDEAREDITELRAILHDHERMLNEATARADKAEDERDEVRAEVATLLPMLDADAALIGDLQKRRTRAERVGEVVLLLEGDEQPRDLRSRAASAERYGYDSYGALLRAIADALKEADDAE